MLSAPSTSAVHLGRTVAAGPAMPLMASRALSERLLQADPRERNLAGQLPLHLAIWHGAPADVVVRLLEQYPESALQPATNSDWLPLHIALQAKAKPSVILTLLEAHPAAAAQAAAYGWLPLHLAARRDASSGVVDALLRAHPGALGALSDSGETPLQLARKHGSRAAALELQEAERRAQDRELAARREAERRQWEAADAESHRALERLVQARVDEKALAETLASSGPDADANAIERSKEQQLLEAVKAQLRHEQEDRKALEEKLENEAAERQRLEAELEAAKAKAKKTSPRAKGDKEKKQKDDASAPAGGGAAGGEWKKCTSKSGKPFWYNKKTKKSVWKDPTGG